MVRVSAIFLLGSLFFCGSRATRLVTAKRTRQEGLDTASFIETFASASETATAAWKELNFKKTLEGHSDRVTGIAFSPDGTKVGTASGDKTAKIWDIAGDDPAAWKELKTLEGHQYYVTGISFSPDGTKVGTASFDETAKIWDIAGDDPAAWKELKTLEGHSGAVQVIAFSPDGTKVGTASFDESHETAKIWDIAGDDPAAWKELKTLEGVTGIAFSPDGTKVGTASEGKTAKIWTKAARFHTHQVGVQNDIEDKPPTPAPRPSHMMGHKEMMEESDESWRMSEENEKMVRMGGTHFARSSADSDIDMASHISSRPVD